MLVTEEEAKTKWCPEVRTGFEGDENRDREWDGSATEAVPEHYACIGSKCMAWRWHGWTEYVETDDTAGLPTFAAKVHTSETHGFCGKAGRPAPISTT